MKDGKTKIVFFDGVCNLCNTFVDYIISRDKNKVLKYASLQGTTALKYLNDHPARINVSSVVFYDDGKILTESKAVLYILKELGGLYPILMIFIIIPSFLRDSIYYWIARNRYKWFGKKESCRLPNPEEKSCFLE